MSGRKIIVIGGACAIAIAALVGGFYLVSNDGGQTRRAAVLDFRSYSSGKTVLTVNGVAAGFVKSASCGEVDADVTRLEAVTTKFGPDPKQIGAPHYEPCKISFGLSMDPELYNWINNAMNGKSDARSVSLQNLDFDYKEVSRIDLNQAMLTEFSMPDLDAASTAAGYMTITVQPQSVLARAGSGAVVSTSTLSTKQRAWLVSNFRFDFGLGKVTAAKVSGIGFKLDAATQRPLFNDFTIAVSENSVADLSKFLNSFLVEGKNAPDSETTAKLTALDSTLANTLATLSFTGVGMSSGELAGLTEGSETVAKRRYTLYVEGANLTVAP